MVIQLTCSLKDLAMEKNGDGLASFYRCPGCNTLIVVACKITGIMRGAVNVEMLDCAGSLGETVNISPKTLSASEKLARWGNLWGRIHESAL